MQYLGINLTITKDIIMDKTHNRIFCLLMGGEFEYWVDNDNVFNVKVTDKQGNESVVKISRMNFETILYQLNLFNDTSEVKLK